MSDPDTDSVLDRLIEALAAQVAAASTPVLAPGAVEALTDLNRHEASLIFGQAGHLAHYGTETDDVRALLRLISDAQPERSATVRPGDEVRLVGELPPSLAGSNEALLRSTTFVVRYLGDDGTVDIQPDLTMDYVIVTVPITVLERSR